MNIAVFASHSGSDLQAIIWCYFTHETWLVCCSNQGKRILFTQSICGNVSTVRE